MISREMLDELKKILIEDYGVVLEQSELEKLAYNLTGFFSVLAKLDVKTKVR